MSAKNWFEKLHAEFQDDPEYQAEELRIDLIEQMLKMMEEKNMSQTQLAKKLGFSNAYITKLLNGSENLTLLKLTQIASVLHSTIDVTFVPRSPSMGRLFQQKKVDAEPREFTHSIQLGANDVVVFPIAA